VGRKKAGYLGTFYKKAVLEEVEKERQVTRICGRFLVVLHIGADLDAHQRAAQQHLIALHFDCAAPAPTLGVTAALAAGGVGELLGLEDGKASLRSRAGRMYAAPFCRIVRVIYDTRERFLKY